MNSQERFAFCSANDQLARGFPSRALRLYTQILTDVSPGHPYAFLHRCVCYILLDRPSLAVYDAWRAILSAKWAYEASASRERSSRQNAAVFKAQIVEYNLNYVHAKRTRNEYWTQEDHLYATTFRDTLLGNHLADLTATWVSPRRYHKPSHKVTHIEHVVLRGHYLLALALFKCGGGALRSADEILCTAVQLYCCGKEEMVTFKILQNHIMEIINQHFEIEKAGFQQLQATLSTTAPHSEVSEEAFKEQNLRGLLDSRYTMIKREQYPWDIYSVTAQTVDDHLPALNDYIQSQIEVDCGIEPQLRPGKVPALRLVAEQDFTSSRLFSEYSPFHVWSCTELKGESTWCVPCDACGASLKVFYGPHSKKAQKGEKMDLDVPVSKREESTHGQEPSLPTSKEKKGSQEETEAEAAVSQEARDFGFFPIRSSTPPSRYKQEAQKPRHRKQPPLFSESSSSIPEEKSEPFPQDTPAGAVETPLSPIEEAQIPSSPLNSPDHTPSEDSDSSDIRSKLRHCPRIEDEIYCNDDCWSKSDIYNEAVCKRDVRQPLLDSVVDKQWISASLPHPNEQRLLNLLMLKVLGMSLVRPDENDHPLELSFVRLLDGNLDEPTPCPPDTLWDDQTPRRRITEYNVAAIPSLEYLFPDYRLPDPSSSSSSTHHAPAPAAPAAAEENATADSPPPHHHHQHTLAPFHFTHNVTGPLDALFALNGERAVMDVRRFDGWILNTLSAKIAHGMRVSRRKRFERVFDERGDVVAEGAEERGGGEEEEGERKRGKSEEGPWVGSLHPVANLVQVAGPGEAPNVKLREREGRLYCRAVWPALPPSPSLAPLEEDATLSEQQRVEQGQRGQERKQERELGGGSSPPEPDPQELLLQLLHAEVEKEKERQKERRKTPVYRLEEQQVGLQQQQGEDEDEDVEMGDVLIHAGTPLLRSGVIKALRYRSDFGCGGGVEEGEGEGEGESRGGEQGEGDDGDGEGEDEGGSSGLPLL